MRALRFASGVAIVLAGIHAPVVAQADSERILRQQTPFHACRETVGSFVAAIGAETGQIRIEADTGAIYRLKVVSTDANLVFICNKVNEAIEVFRTTPGEAVVAGR